VYWSWEGRIRRGTVRRAAWIVLLALPWLGVVARRASAQASATVTVGGRVIAADDGRGIPGASVRFGADSPVTTDPEGTFSSRLPAGASVMLVVQAIGFRPESASVTTGAMPLTITVTLARITPLLDTARVAAEPGPPGFAMRRRMGKGVFFDRKDLEERRVPSVADLLRTVPGVQVRSQSRGFEYALQFDRCRNVLVFLDGQEMRGWTPAEALRMVSPATLTAVEVYTSPIRLPPEFRRMDSCGAVVMWTR